MTSQTKSIQDEIEQAIARRKIAAEHEREREVQLKQLHQAALIAAMRKNLGGIFDSLDGAEIIYIAEPEDDYAKAAIMVTVDGTRYTCYVTHAKSWTQFGVSISRYGIDHYASLDDLRNEILLTIIQQIEYDRANSVPESTETLTEATDDQPHYNVLADPLFEPLFRQ